MNIEQMNSYLVADDDDIFRMRLARALRERGSSVIEAANSNQALDAVRSSEMSLVQRAILDLRMPGMSGLSLVSELLTLRPRLQIVMLTGYGSIATAVQAINLGCVNYLSKPVTVDDILAAFAGRQASTQLEHSVKDSTPSLERVEWEHIQRVLNDHHGNITHAAKALGVHRRSLQRKIQRYAPK